jgi:predicted transcriptional regulator
MNLKDKNLNEKQLNFLKEFIDDGPSQGEDIPIKDILLSIKPKYVQKIRSGKKQWEFRKQIWSNNKIIDKIYLYETSPKQRITSYFRASRVINADPNHIWELCKDQAGISKEGFFTYFNGHDEGYAIKISNFHELEDPIDPYESFRGFNAPQNFIYITIKNNENKKKRKTLDEHLGFKISKEQKNELEELAKKRNKSLSKVVRELISKSLKDLKASKPPDLNPPPRPNKPPKKPKKNQKSITESFYTQIGVDPADRKELIEEFKEKTKLCTKHNEKYIGKECPYCKEEREKEGDV